MSKHRKTLLTLTFFVLGPGNGIQAQVAPPTILTIDVQNRVQYFEDISDHSRFAIDPNVTTANLSKNFTQSVIISDIVAINGERVTGTVVEHIRMLNLSKAPSAGQAIADIARNNIQLFSFEILGTDGSQIGTIVAGGFGGGTAPPGSPLALTQGNNAIVGGVGAFLGVRGHVGSAVTAQTVVTRQASISEDPAARRTLGGGRARFIARIIPMETPQIVATPNGPAVTHSTDFTLVSASKPAAPGEILSLFGTGLGSVAGVDPGQPFPANPLAPVNSPIAVTVNGASAQVLSAVGFPGTINGYQVNFRVPLDASKGNALVQVSAAWIAGAPVTIAVQ